MDYCYNNAVIHVFLGSLTQLIVPHHKAKYKHSEKDVEEILEFAIVDPPTPADEQLSSETPMTGKICGQALVQKYFSREMAKGLATSNLCILVGDAACWQKV